MQGAEQEMESAAAEAARTQAVLKHARQVRGVGKQGFGAGAELLVSELHLQTCLDCFLHCTDHTSCIM